MSRRTSPSFAHASTPSPCDPSRARLDHIVVRIPWKDLLEPPAWITQNFVLTPGGRHTDDKTENKLIVFPDSSYIELIAFVEDDPKRREGHWWGDKQPGIVDLAFTTDGEAKDYHEILEKRLRDLGSRLGVGYAPPVKGARKRPDGQEVRWEVTFPAGARRGEVPFFCHDLTPRELRVPRAHEAGMEHPCGTYGLKSITVSVPRERAAEIVKIYSAAFGVENTASEEGHGTFQIGRVEKIAGVDEPHIYIKPLDDESREPLLAQQGVLLGDLVLGGISPTATGTAIQLDTQEPMGRIMLELSLPPVQA